MAALPYKAPGDEASDEFPLILVTGRRLEHYNAGTMTRRTGNLELMDHDWLELHPDDAAAPGVGDGDLVDVRSRGGEIKLVARLTERIDPGHVFTAFHFPEVRTNLLVGTSSDVNTAVPSTRWSPSPSSPRRRRRSRRPRARASRSRRPTTSDRAAGALR